MKLAEEVMHYLHFLMYYGSLVSMLSLIVSSWIHIDVDTGINIDYYKLIICGSLSESNVTIIYEKYNNKI